MKKALLITLFILFAASSSAQVVAANEKSSKDNEEKGLEPMVAPVDFDKIKDVIQNDRLGSEVVKKTEVIKKKQQKRAVKKVGKYNIPDSDEFWSFFSEYWLVKNATVLKWDFKKPDYGLDESFKSFLESLGIFEVRYKILLVNTPDVTHFALPSNEDEYIFLLSVPFIRTLDLSKLEISLLLFEDYLRVKYGYFKNYASVPGLENFIGGNFYQKDFNVNLLEKVARKYDEIIFDKGFNFQQQFNVTSRMNAMLKSNTKLWNGYYLMIGKIDNLVKTNFLYQKYLKIYPSPELQLSWLRPKRKKVL
ncbi:MAG: hypothetical protein K9K67_09365 [Bacteriovoracaceae bacterium]|nr:hypothetical protein [Bacteriovoracaceae bacterium]